MPFNSTWFERLVTNLIWLVLLERNKDNMRARYNLWIKSGKVDEAALWAILVKHIKNLDIVIIYPSLFKLELNNMICWSFNIPSTWFVCWKTIREMWTREFTFQGRLRGIKCDIQRTICKNTKCLYNSYECSFCWTLNKFQCSITTITIIIIIITKDFHILTQYDIFAIFSLLIR